MRQRLTIENFPSTLKYLHKQLFAILLYLVDTAQFVSFSLKECSRSSLKLFMFQLSRTSVHIKLTDDLALTKIYFVRDHKVISYNIRII